MPVIYHQNISTHCKLAIWQIEETEAFFLQQVSLQAHITHPKKRLQHLAGRYLLSYLFPNFPYSQIQIADTRKPYLQQQQYQFSISHTGNYAAAIVSSTHRLGIDIEPPTERVYLIAHKFLSPEERALIDSYPTDNKTALLTTAWCVKEALYKWLGKGNVNFITMLRILKINEETIDCYIDCDSEQQFITVQYKFLYGLCVVWTI